jgi:hypothetical protein
LIVMALVAGWFSVVSPIAPADISIVETALGHGSHQGGVHGKRNAGMVVQAPVVKYYPECVTVETDGANSGRADWYHAHKRAAFLSCLGFGLREAMPRRMELP